MLRKPMLKRLTTFLAGLMAALTISLAAPAAEYPTHPVTLIVAFTPGGPSDVLARIVGRHSRTSSTSRSLSTTGPAPAATSPPSRSRTRRPTATRC